MGTTSFWTLPPPLTSLINTYVNKSYKAQQEQVTSKETNFSTICFCRALDNSKQDVTTYYGVPALILHLSFLLKWIARAHHVPPENCPWPPLLQYSDAGAGQHASKALPLPLRRR